MEEKTDLELFTEWVRKLPCNHAIFAASDWYDITTRNKEVLPKIKLDHTKIQIDNKNNRFRIILDLS